MQNLWGSERLFDIIGTDITSNVIFKNLVSMLRYLLNSLQINNIQLKKDIKHAAKIIQVKEYPLFEKEIYGKIFTLAR